MSTPTCRTWRTADVKTNAANSFGAWQSQYLPPRTFGVNVGSRSTPGRGARRENPASSRLPRPRASRTDSPAPRFLSRPRSRGWSLNIMSLLLIAIP